MKRLTCMIVALFLVLLVVSCSCRCNEPVATAEPTTVPVAETSSAATPVPTTHMPEETVSPAPTEDPTPRPEGPEQGEVPEDVILDTNEGPEDDIPEGSETGSPEVLVCNHAQVEYRVTKLPSCEEVGESACICTVCGEVLRSEQIAATGHRYSFVSDQNGHKEVCSVCGSATKYSAHSFVNEVCTVCGEGCTHNYTEEVTAPTCTEEGYTTHTCTLCGHIEQDTYTEATGHSYHAVMILAATCTEDGTMKYTCIHCSDSFTTKIPTHGHHIVTDQMVTATCQHTGLTEGRHCDHCGLVIVAQETIPISNHVYMDGVCIWCGSPMPDGGGVELPEEEVWG